ncbi:MAG TPA: uracil-DNA glycosylase, partial [Nitrososphaerales archaeon]|nr:uracil-DNA glycosylase [Nitrososphaerales archaeon]
MRTGPRFEALSAQIIGCRRCPRLVEYREHIPPTRAFAHQEYWRKPVPGFGDLDGRLLILGLAPARNGANRTGRI